MYRLVVAPRARDEIESFLDWLTNYNVKTAEDFRLDLERAVSSQLLESPKRWPYFFLTGSPFRAYLYTVSRRTSYWIVYEVDEERQLVAILRFWNGARDPAKFAV
jgi:plasmid stabilization system protein ParE